MPASIKAGQSITATPTESNAQGPVVVDPKNLSWTMDIPGVATFTVDQATGVATFTGVSDGTLNVTLADTKFNLAFSDVLTVGTGQVIPTAIGITWGPAVG